MHKSETHGFDWWRGESLSYRRAMLIAAKLAVKGHAVPVSNFEFVSVRKPFCDSPVPLVFAKGGKDAGAPVAVNFFGPCRKCERCLLFRQMRWRERIHNEIAKTVNRGNRSWFITLTFSPVHLAGILAEAKVAGRTDPAMVERCAYKHVQQYLDRVRKAAKARFRYCAVSERGEKNGRLHYHILLHELGTRPVLKATIEIWWRSIVHARLVYVPAKGKGLATYLSKYVTKDSTTRPRASLRYGAERH